jgi:hypothetical protein
MSGATLGVSAQMIIKRDIYATLSHSIEVSIKLRGGRPLSRDPDVRFGSLADIPASPRDVRFALGNR